MKLLDGSNHKVENLLKRMESDEYYYGYLGGAALSSSSAKKLLESPYSYHLSLQEKDTSSAALREGRLLHMMVLEPHKVDALTIVDGTRRAKAYKDSIKEFGYENVFTKSEYDKCRVVADRLHSLEAIVDVLKDCDYEVPAMGLYDGLPFRGKADAVTKGRSVVYDVKTTSDFDNWAYSAKKYHYDLQAALYLELFGAYEFKFIVVDKGTLQVGLYSATDEFIESGKRKLLKATENYRKYLEIKGGINQIIYYGEI